MFKKNLILFTAVSLLAAQAFAISPGAGQAQMQNNMQQMQQNKQQIQQMQQHQQMQQKMQHEQQKIQHHKKKLSTPPDMQ